MTSTTYSFKITEISFNPKTQHNAVFSYWYIIFHILYYFYFHGKQRLKFEECSNCCSFIILCRKSWPRTPKNSKAPSALYRYVLVQIFRSRTVFFCEFVQIVIHWLSFPQPFPRYCIVLMAKTVNLDIWWQNLHFCDAEEISFVPPVKSSRGRKTAASALVTLKTVNNFVHICLYL